MLVSTAAILHHPADNELAVSRTSWPIGWSTSATHGPGADKAHSDNSAFSLPPPLQPPPVPFAWQRSMGEFSYVCVYVVHSTERRGSLGPSLSTNTSMPVFPGTAASGSYPHYPAPPADTMHPPPQLMTSGSSSLSTGGWSYCGCSTLV